MDNNQQIEMKAKDKFWENFAVSSGAAIPESFRKEPKNHDRYKWISQDGRVFKVAEIEDKHLGNIYVMLTKSLAFHEELKESIDIFGEPRGEMAQEIYMAGIASLYDQIHVIRKNLHHIAYEIHKRGLFINHFNVSEHVAQKS